MYRLVAKKPVLLHIAKVIQPGKRRIRIFQIGFLLGNNLGEDVGRKHLKAGWKRKGGLSESFISQNFNLAKLDQIYRSIRPETMVRD